MATDKAQLKKLREKCRLSFLKEYDKIVKSDPSKKLEKLRLQWKDAEIAAKAAQEAYSKAMEVYFSYMKDRFQGDLDKYYDAVDKLQPDNYSELSLKTTIFSE